MLLSLITINYNTASETAAAVASMQQVLEAAAYPYEILVVDNHSREEEYLPLEQVEGIRLIRNGVNGGFAAANNLGIAHATGRYIMLINSDTRLKEDIFSPMIAFLECHPEVGALSPRICYNSTPYRIQYGGYRYDDNYLFKIRSIAHGELANEQGELKPLPTASAHGAAMMLPRRVIESIPPMREDYFLYFEEIDYSLQIRKAGYAIYHFPAATIYHNASGSVGDNSPLKIYYNSRNRLFLAWNNLRGGACFCSLLRQLVVSFPQSLFHFLMRREWALAHAYACGVFDFLRGKRGKW